MGWGDQQHLRCDLHTPAGFTDTDSFTYIASDSLGGLSAAATVTVAINAPVQEAVNIDRAEFRTRRGDLRLQGTSDVPGPGNTITAVLDRTGATIGTAVVDVLGDWRIQVSGSAVEAAIGDTVTVTSSNLATATVSVSR